uniref:Glycoprotein D/GG/GX domain protein n=1 Tax=Anatid alphaherpesvirus 2 TaxID=3080522 RepID=A0AAU0K6K6_9ALPH
MGSLRTTLYSALAFLLIAPLCGVSANGGEAGNNGATTHATTTSGGTTTLKIPFPDVPDEGKHKLVWTLSDYRIPSPLSRSEAHKYPTKHVVYTQGCGFAPLIPASGPDPGIMEKILKGSNTYSAKVAWFKLGKECARPIYLREYNNCSVRGPLGACAVKSVQWWDGAYFNMAFIDTNELDLVLAAPSSELAGLYTRVILIGDIPITADIMLTIAGRCWFSRQDTGGGKCYPLTFYPDGNVNSIGMKSINGHLTHATVVKYWFRTHGGHVPKLFHESTMYRAHDLPSDLWKRYMDNPGSWVFDPSMLNSTNNDEPERDDDTHIDENASGDYYPVVPSDPPVYPPDNVPERPGSSDHEKTSTAPTTTASTTPPPTQDKKSQLSPQIIVGIVVLGVAVIGLIIFCSVSLAGKMKRDGGRRRYRGSRPSKRSYRQLENDSVA